jgi:hypothetical protein
VELQVNHHAGPLKPSLLTKTKDECHVIALSKNPSQSPSSHLSAPLFSFFLYILFINVVLGDTLWHL